MEIVSPDNLRGIAMALPIVDVLRLCTNNTLWKRYVYDNDDFWRSRLNQDYPNVGVPYPSCRDRYAKLRKGSAWYLIDDGGDLTDLFPLGQVLFPPGQVLTGISQVCMSGNVMYALDKKSGLWKGRTKLPFPSNAAVTQISAASGVLFVLDREGVIWGHGNNRYRQITSSGPENIEGFVAPPSQPSDIRSVQCGGEFTLVMRGDGTVWGTGKNTFGVLGEHYREDRGFQHIPEITLKIEKVSCGWDYAMFIDKEGGLWGMGGNTWGQFGTDDEEPRDRPVRLGPEETSLYKDAQDVSCGVFTTTVLGSRGDVYMAGGSDPKQRVRTFTHMCSDAAKISLGSENIYVIDVQHRVHRLDFTNMTRRQIADVYAWDVRAGQGQMAFYGVPLN